MNDNQKRLKQRVVQAAEEALHKKQYVSPIDVFLGMQSLQPIHLDNWKKGKVSYLEEVLQGNLHKLSFCMKCFREWALEKGLKPSLTVYQRKGRNGNIRLRFSISGNPEIEKSYSTHYISHALSEASRKKIQEKMDNPLELTVFRICKDSQCEECKKKIFKGGILFMEADQPLCLSCAKLDALEYLPRGNAKLTRYVTKNSTTRTVVVEFSRSRKRYERQGVLVEKKILEAAKKELLIEDSDSIPF
ncbi:MAG: hypothetical protein V4489_06780 [Chlamydiota bacterium]